MAKMTGDGFADFIINTSRTNVQHFVPPYTIVYASSADFRRISFYVC